VALITVLLIVAVYLVLYEHIVNSRVTPSKLILALVGTALLVLVFYDRLASFMVNRTLWRTTGIIEYAPNANDFLPRFRDLIDDAQEDVWFAGVSFYISLPANQAYFLNALERGINVRFLIYNPLSPNVADVAAGFSQSVDELKSESEMTIRSLMALGQQAKQRRASGNLDIRLFTIVPKMRLYVIDKHSERGVTFFIPHVDHQNTPNTPGFLARNLKTGVAPAFIEGLDRVWNAAMPWDEFMKIYQPQGAAAP
jgi:hypothetical protein